MFRKTALLAALCLLPLTQASAESWFEVEVFLFERNQPSTEVWPETPKQPNIAKGLDLITPALVAVPDIQPCSDDERVVDPLRCDGLDLQIAAYAPEYPKPFPVTVASASPKIAAQGASAVLLDKSQLRFNDAVRQLSRENGVKPLLHMSWQQAMQPRHTSVPVRLFAGEDFSDRFVAAGTRVPPLQPYPEVALSNDGSADTQSLEPESTGSLEQPQVNNLTALLGGEPANLPALRTEKPSPVWQLDGLLNIYLNHYLYIETDLMLRTPGSRKVELLDTSVELAVQGEPDTQPAAQRPIPLMATSEPIQESQGSQVVMEEQPFLYSIPLTQNRRVRSGQIHYFDHPKFGLIIQIRKMAQPTGAVDVEEPASEQEGDDTPEGDVINQQNELQPEARNQPQD
ncbi:peptidoglycan binding protein CsiV [Shewanella sp.]|uniref:peptidoglycan binding protein CsiV n=1 Tax=Shewanella sp. TaxID=50422 RepID=UPI0035625B68